MPAVRNQPTLAGTLPYRVVKPTPSSKAKAASDGAKAEYDKALMVTLVLVQAKPDWVQIASAMNGKTESKTHDTWRKVVDPNLVAGRAWSNEAGSGAAWSTKEKIKMVTMILEGIKVDWQVVAEGFPGRTKAHVYDMWRKVVFYKLKRGEALA